MKHSMVKTALVRAVSQLFWYVVLLISFSILPIISVYRYFVGLYLQRKYNRPIEFVKGLDAVFCLTNEISSNNVESCNVFKGTCDINKLRQRVDERWFGQKREVDGKWKLMRFRQQLMHEFGYFFWISQADFRIENHVKLHDGPPLNSNDDLQKLIVWQTSNLPEDKGICWQILLVRLSDTYLTEKPEPKFMLLSCTNHALCDGISGFQLQAELFDDYSKTMNSNVRSPRVRLSERITFWRECLLYGLADSFAHMFKTEKHCLLGAPLTGNIFVSVSESLDIGKVKKIKNFYKTTVHDVLQSCVAGALRRHVVSEGQPIPSLMRFTIPISLHSLNKEAKVENNLTNVIVEMPVDEPTCVGRLMKTKLALGELKRAPDVYIRYFTLKMFSNRLPSIFARHLAKRNSATALVTCVPNNTPNTLFGNEEFQQNFAVGAVMGMTGSGLTFTIVSRNEGAICAIKADSAIVKSQQHLNRMNEFLSKEIDELYQTI